MQGPSLLRAWRLSRGLSQCAAARAMSVVQPTWSDWELGKTIPRTAAAAQLEDLTEGACPMRAWVPAAEPKAAG